MPPAILFSMIGLVVWEGLTMEGCTDLYRTDDGTLTAIRFQDEICTAIV